MKSFGKTNSDGQTLIETLVALFILVMGVSAATGLAVYAFGTSTNINKQIIAAGLAREGLEAVRNMRDANWLQDTLAVNGCFDFAPNPPTYPNGTPNHANCYQNWLGTNGNVPFYCLDPSTGNGANCNGNLSNLDYYVGFNFTNQNFWIFKKDSANYGINLDKNNSGNSGFYSEDGTTSCNNATSDYCRQVSINKITTGPYDPNNSGGSNQTPGPLVFVQSKVWWIDKKCPRVNTFDAANPACRIELDTYLTNWKNF
jgi:type II secretory pathway pseudopilin PulG